MKKMIALLVVLVFVLGFTGVAIASPAATEGATGLEASPHFESTDWGYSADGTNAGSPRFAYDGGIGVDSQGGQNASECSVVTTTFHGHTRIEPGSN